MTDHILPHNHGEHLNTELLIDNIAKTEDFQIVADLFKVLGDNSRVRIFWLLCHCEECVINISSMMDMSSCLSPSPPAEILRTDHKPQRGERSLLQSSRHKPGTAVASYDRAGD